jgi:hypothetical protein
LEKNEKKRTTFLPSFPISFGFGVGVVGIVVTVSVMVMMFWDLKKRKE